MQAARTFIGVDVSKQELVIASHDSAAVVPGTIANSRTAIRTWLKRLHVDSVIAMEATGGYERLLAQLAYERGLEVYVLNPRQVHHYAVSLGNRGKTDRMDAQVIARYVAMEYTGLHRYEPVPQELVELQQLQGQRATIMRARTMLDLSLQRRSDLRSSSSRRSLKALDDWMKELDRQLLAGIKSHAELSRQFDLLTSITGIGPQSGAALSVLLTRIKFADSDAVVAYCGLDPRPRDSGRRKGVRQLSKQGDKGLRALLYNAASSACRTAVFRAYYQSLRSRGLKGTEALVALARKILRTAYAVSRSGKPFDPARLQCQPG
ncbi:IS110 family transposase ISPpu10 [Achromobacter piechaudii]|uniref:IS110 family transposase n=1 Tax=Achromobacter piechaudii TaxID=72556 RepID=UPI0014683CB6|nr:IS110 family transposase [Achromobacter piechaudii]CAB3924135.1 IS110 family transposase ISPpu10 [Achromobacter piechaudii]